MVPIKTINADTKSSMLLPIKNEDFPKIYLIFFDVEKYLIFLDVILSWIQLLGINWRPRFLSSILVFLKIYCIAVIDSIFFLFRFCREKQLQGFSTPLPFCNGRGNTKQNENNH